MIDYKEIMVGDWLMFRENEGMSYGQVTGMNAAFISLSNSKAGDFDRKSKRLYPIPLTAELLEKNGFRKITLDNVDKGTTDYYIDPDIVGYYNMDKRERVHASQIVYIIGHKWLFVDDKTECRIEMWCPYVHTFQHAMRLCGIEKEIEL